MSEKLVKITEEDEKMPSIKKKIVDVKEILIRISEEKCITEEEVNCIRYLLEEQDAVIDMLKEEIFQMKVKFPELQLLYQEFASYKEDVTEKIVMLNHKLNNTKHKVLDLDKKLTQFGIDVVLMESSKAKEIDSLDHQWKEIIKERDINFKNIIEETVKKHWDIKKGYEATVQSLKEQIAHKEEEIARCQFLMKERDSNSHKEICNLKKKLEVASTRDPELLQQQLVGLERRVNEMTLICLKLQQDYQQEITSLNMAKDSQARQEK